MTDVKINLKGLEQLIRALKGKPPTLRIGILGGGARSEGGPSNAQIGAWHEFGTSKMPQRSFLRIPLSEHLEGELKKAGALDEQVLADVVNEGSLVPYLKKVGVAAEAVVADAFDTGGFGRWAPLKANTLSRKRVHQILVETQQLRNSITSEVQE